MVLQAGPYFSAGIFGEIHPRGFSVYGITLRRVLLQHPVYQALQILPLLIKIAYWVAEWEEEGMVLDCRCKKEMLRT